MQKTLGWGWKYVRSWGSKGIQTEVMLASWEMTMEMRWVCSQNWLIQHEKTEKDQEIGVGWVKNGLKKWVEKGDKE